MADDLYLIDSNVLLTPYHLYYPPDLAPGFWKQMKKHIESGKIILLDLVKEEIDAKDDGLSDWLNGLKIKHLIQYDKDEMTFCFSDINRYIGECGYYVTDKALAEWNHPSADPWLVAAAHLYGYNLVTLEIANPNLGDGYLRKKAKIPDLCDKFNFRCCNLLTMMRELSIMLG